MHICWMNERMNEPICMKGNDPFAGDVRGGQAKAKETMRCQSKLEMKW